MADAPVDRVLLDRGVATGVEATVTVDGDAAPLRVRAAQTVVAAGALRTPVVLLRSGLGHPAVGGHLRLHPVVVVGAFLDEDVTMWRGTSQGSRSLEHSAATGASPSSPRRARRASSGSCSRGRGGSRSGG